MASGKGTLLKNLGEYVAERHDAAAWRGIVDSLPPDDRAVLDGLLLVGGWYPVGIWNRAVAAYLQRYAAQSIDQEMTAIDSVDERLEVRESVTKYLSSNHPEWRIQGLSLTHFSEDADYFIAADVMDGSTPKIVQLRAWFFVKDNGETYWKIALMDS